jgi:hypothetical protein
LKWQAEGVKVGDMRAKEKLIMDAPRPGAIQRGIEKLAAKREEIESEKTYRMVEKLKAANDFVIPRDEVIWKDYCLQLDSHRKNQHTMESFLKKKKYVFGSVFAASGLREVPAITDTSKFAIRDWALIRPEKHRGIGLNKIAVS